MIVEANKGKFLFLLSLMQKDQRQKHGQTFLQELWPRQQDGNNREGVINYRLGQR